LSDTSEHELHVGLTGPTKSGKTNLFIDLERCIDLGFHGFERWRELAIETNRVHRALIRGFNRSLPQSTLSATDIRFQLRYRSASLPHDVTVHVRDAPGEAAFPRSSDNTAMKQAKEDLDKWFEKAAGIVLVISVVGAGTHSGFMELIDKVEDFFQKAGEPGFLSLERVVVAISMFDLLMLRFGPQALDVATDPKAVLAILHEHMRPAFDVLRDFRPFAQSDARLDLRFVATSSYGFHTGFGCPNVETMDEKFDPKDAQFPGPLRPETKRYPYMTADPFVFAAVGLDSPFLFTREEILQGVVRERAAG
jgi:hypothetical protein